MVHSTGVSLVPQSQLINGPTGFGFTQIHWHDDSLSNFFSLFFVVTFLLQVTVKFGI